MPRQDSVSAGSIQQICWNPALTRRLAGAGQKVPCYRCLAHRPDTQPGCAFLTGEWQTETAKPALPEKLEQPKLW